MGATCLSAHPAGVESSSIRPGLLWFFCSCLIGSYPSSYPRDYRIVSPRLISPPSIEFGIRLQLDLSADGTRYLACTQDGIVSSTLQSLQHCQVELATIARQIDARKVLSRGNRLQNDALIVSPVVHTCADGCIAIDHHDDPVWHHVALQSWMSGP